MFNLDYSEFYITNVCNLTCEDCNRYNNFAFKGHSRWDDHSAAYAQWSKILNIKEIGILGGEPLLNPDLLNWINGVAGFWKNCNIAIHTNGTQLKKWPSLLETLEKYNGRVCLIVSVHDHNQRQEIVDNVHYFYKNKFYSKNVLNHNAWRISYNNVKDSTWPECDNPEDFDRLPDYIQEECKNIHNIEPASSFTTGMLFHNDNNVRVKLNMLNYFTNTTIKYNQMSNTVTVHDSDPKKAIEACSFKTCHHFIDGKLYKCGPVGILPEFIKQFKVQLTDNQQTLINSYEAAQPDWSNDQLTKFMNNLTNHEVIPQCSLCPESFETKKIIFTKHRLDRIPNLKRVNPV